MRHGGGRERLARRCVLILHLLYTCPHTTPAICVLILHLLYVSSYYTCYMCHTTTAIYVSSYYYCYTIRHGRGRVRRARWSLKVALRAGFLKLSTHNIYTRASAYEDTNIAAVARLARWSWDLRRQLCKLVSWNWAHKYPRASAHEDTWGQYMRASVSICM